MNKIVYIGCEFYSHVFFSPKSLISPLDVFEGTCGGLHVGKQFRSLSWKFYCSKPLSFRVIVVKLADSYSPTSTDLSTCKKSLFTVLSYLEFRGISFIR